MISIVAISHEEATGLLELPASLIRGLEVFTEALPPPEVLRRLLKTSGHWTIPRLFVDTEQQAVVGSGGFKSPPLNGRVEIGYGVAHRVRGRGVATEAIRQLVTEAFGSDEVNEVIAETSVYNPASRRVLEKVGFVHMGQRMDAEDGLMDCWSNKRT